MANPKALFETLANQNVEYVVIGKVGAALRGIPVVAESTEVCVRYNDANTQRVVDALVSINAKIQLDHGVVNTPISTGMLTSAWRDLPAGLGHRFVTDVGLVDIIYDPRGIETTA